ncbi:MAG: hypothetical protein AAGE94_20740, partial [Acidobacteriota bacterium]
VLVLASICLGTPPSRATAPPPTPLLASPVELATATLEANGVWRGFAAHGTAEVFRIDLPTAGIATIEVATPRLDANPVRLDVHRVDQLAGTKVLDRSATRLVVATRDSGSWWLRVSARHVGRFKVLTHFAPATIRDDQLDFEARGHGGSLHARRTSFYAIDGDPSPFKNQPEVIDPDPDTTRGDTGRLLARFWRLESLSPLDKNQPEVIDPDPDTATVTDPELDHVVHVRISCRSSDRVDDHGDSGSCATPLALGERTTGSIDNLWGDDTDRFELTLSEPTTLEVHLDEAIARSSTVVAELDDCAGRRLASDLDGPILATVDQPLVATVGPGRVCVRVEAGVASEAYALQVIPRTP